MTAMQAKLFQGRLLHHEPWAVCSGLNVPTGTLLKETGHVEVTWACDSQDGDVDMTWSGRGSPKVMPPPRRGLGTRRIGRQIFCELDGTSDVGFAAGGLAVKTHIPRLESQETEKIKETET